MTPCLGFEHAHRDQFPIRGAVESVSRTRHRRNPHFIRIIHRAQIHPIRSVCDL